jgi:hypothetical protein
MLRALRSRFFSNTSFRRSDAVYVVRFCIFSCSSLTLILQHKNTDYNNPSIAFEFSSEHGKMAQEIIAKYPDQYKKAAIIPLLDLAQRQLGWTSISAMNYVAKLVDVPPMRVYEVATFYTMFNRYIDFLVEAMLIG